jgi:antitoxin (DNA-binding transcriptional repressor) of toxin-antitoxin stability system
MFKREKPVLPAPRLGLEGEKIVIIRNGVPVAELIPAHRRASNSAFRMTRTSTTSRLPRDDWWKPITGRGSQPTPVLLAL